MNYTRHTTHDYDYDDYGAPYVGVYTIVHNIAGYMPDDDTPYVVVCTPYDAVAAYADVVGDDVDALLDAEPYDDDVRYVNVDGVGTYYVDADNDVRVCDDIDARNDADDVVQDIRADILRRLVDDDAVQRLYDYGAVGVYVDADDAPTYYYDVSLMDDDAYADIVAAAAPGAYDAAYDDYAVRIVDDVRDAAVCALHAAHVDACDSTTCDVCAAADYGHYDAAAHLYAGATETPYIVGVYLSSFDPRTVLDAWAHVSQRISARCTACDAYTYPRADDVYDVDDYETVVDAYADVSTVCDNCRTAAVAVPAHVYAVTVNDETSYYSRTTYVRTRADVDADDVASSFADDEAARLESHDADDYYGAAYVDVVQYDYAYGVRRYDVAAASYYVDVSHYVDASHDDYDADDADNGVCRIDGGGVDVRAVRIVDAYARETLYDAADVVVHDVNGAPLTAHDVYGVANYDGAHDAAVHVYDVDAWTSYAGRAVQTSTHTTHAVAYDAARRARRDVRGLWRNVYMDVSKGAYVVNVVDVD